MRRLIENALVATAITIPCSGCASLWQEVPPAEGNKPKVVMDASWYLDNPSGELIERLAQERKDHIERTLAQRQSGSVGRPLDQMLEQSRVQSDRGSGLVTESSDGLTLSLSSHSSHP